MIYKNETPIFSELLKKYFNELKEKPLL